MIGNQSLPMVSYCQLNVSQCAPSEAYNRFVVNVYNSMAREVSRYIRVPVASGISFKVLDTLGTVCRKYLQYVGWLFKLIME